MAHQHHADQELRLARAGQGTAVAEVNLRFCFCGTELAGEVGER
jgi:hypothetical protein